MSAISMLSEIVFPESVRWDLRRFPSNEPNEHFPGRFYLANRVIAGCEGREARRSVTARLTLSREFFERVFRASFSSRKHSWKQPATFGSMHAMADV
jgi:hypothetical protein